MEKQIDAEMGTCDHCGERTEVAVSDTQKGQMRICEPCAEWAVDQIAEFVIRREEERLGVRPVVAIVAMEFEVVDG